MMRVTLTIAALCVSACVTSYENQLAKELVEKSRFVYKKPQIDNAQRTGIPYAAQEEHHASVEAALQVWIEQHKDHLICTSPREARIGVLDLGLPNCGEFKKQYGYIGNLDPPGLEIGPIDVGNGYGNRPFVSFSVFEFAYAGNVANRTNQVYACIRRGNTVLSEDGKTWTVQQPDRRLPFFFCAEADFVIVV